MVLITGGTGHLGNVIIKKLIAESEKVRVLVQPGDSLYSLQFLPIEIVYGDIRGDIKKAFKGVDAVFHLASVISITNSNKKLIYSVNVDGTNNIINLAKEYRIPLIYVSSVHAFSEVKPGSVVDENTPIDENNIVGDYAKSKALATKKVMEAFKNGLSGFIVFPTGIFGPYDYRFSYFSRILEKYRLGKLRITVNGCFDFVDVRDVTNGIVALYNLLKERYYIVNHQSYIVSGNKIYFEKLPLLCGLRKYKILKKSSARLISYLILLCNSLFKIPVEFVPYALHTLELDYTFSHEKLSKTISYCPRKVEETIQDFFKWLDEIHC